MRYAVLHDFKLNGFHCVTFVEVAGDTEILSFACYPTKHEALLEKSIFEYRDIWQQLSHL